MRGKYEIPYQKRWAEFHGETVNYLYNPVIKFGEIYCWIDCYSNVGRSSLCFHDRCPECHGTGHKQNGQSCIHMISCPCIKCNPYFC